MCKQVTKEIAKELEDPTYQAKVVAELEQVCRQLPNTTPAMQEKCATQVDKEGPVLMTQMSDVCFECVCVCVRARARTCTCPLHLPPHTHTQVLMTQFAEAIRLHFCTEAKICA